MSARYLCKRLVTAALLAASVTALGACSTELASIDDVYVPSSVEERFPIRVADKPLKLTLDVNTSGVRPGDVQEVRAFASAVAAASSPVTIAYPAGSPAARKGAAEVADIMMRQGVAQSAIHMTRYEGKSNVVAVSSSRKLAYTKPCGDWSENLRAAQTNDDLGADFGCSFQRNTAAMVTDPEDFVRPKPMPPAMSSARNPALQQYQAGTWTVPVADPNAITSN